MRNCCDSESNPYEITASRVRDITPGTRKMTPRERTEALKDVQWLPARYTDRGIPAVGLYTIQQLQTPVTSNFTVDHQQLSASLLGGLHLGHGNSLASTDVLWVVLENRYGEREIKSIMLPVDSYGLWRILPLWAHSNEETTTVISQRPDPENKQAYQAWQDRMTNEYRKYRDWTKSTAVARGDVSSVMALWLRHNGYGAIERYNIRPVREYFLSIE